MSVVVGPERVTARAYAKINLTLTVRGRRDDGYHDIDTLFATVGVHDTVTVSATDANGVTGSTMLEGTHVGEVAPSMDERNLAWQAATAWRAADIGSPGWQVDLVKRLPVAAGLGGGSSDAAATLRAIAAVRAGHADPRAIAATLGSDVPFFVTGEGAAWGTGRGEILEPVTLLPRPVVALNLGEAVPVRVAYGAWEPHRGSPGAATLLHGAIDTLDAWHRHVVEVWNGGGELPPGNDLEKGVATRYPGVAASLDALRSERLTSVRMSGSGATCFGVAEDPDHARYVVDRLSARHPRAWVAWSFAPAGT